MTFFIYIYLLLRFLVLKIVNYIYKSKKSTPAIATAPCCVAAAHTRNQRKFNSVLYTLEFKRGISTSEHRRGIKRKASEELLKEISQLRSKGEIYAELKGYEQITGKVSKQCVTTREEIKLVSRVLESYDNPNGDQVACYNRSTDYFQKAYPEQIDPTKCYIPKKD